MKIGVVSNLYPPVDRGGAEQVAWRISHELHTRGHDVFVVSTTPFRGINSFHPHITERLVQRVYRFYPPNVYHLLNDYKYPAPVRALWHWNDLYSPAPARALKTVFQKEQPDVVLTHNFKGFGIQAARFLRNTGVHQIHTLHDVQLSIPSGLLIYGNEKNWLNNSFLRRWYERQTQWAVGSPEVVLAPSKFIADFHKERGFFPDSRVEVLPNPAPNIAAPNDDRRSEKGTLRLLYAGQLEHHKGVPFLLDALNTADMPFELLLAGNGSLSEYVSDWAERDARMTYHGFVSLEKLLQLFVSCDGVIVPSLCYENSPTIIYEAFQAGVPVIASDIGGVGELVVNGKNGYLFEPGNTEAFLRSVKRLAQDADGLRGKREQIKETVAPYRLRTYVDTLEKFFPG